MTTANISEWFQEHSKPEGSIDVTVHILDDSKNPRLQEFMAKEIPSCYISKENLNIRTNVTGYSASQIIKNKIPNPGSVMAGDFGEILTLFYLDGELEEEVLKVKKWRFKQDRNKAAPHSDVILLYKAEKDKPSAKDFVVCAEAKMKSTKNSSTSPIEASITDSDKDKTGRLARTLSWLKEKEIDHGDEDSISFMNRFTREHLDVSFSKKFRAVAIIDRKFLDEELLKELPTAIPVQDDTFEVVVLAIKDLKDLYGASFECAVNEGDVHE